jgi:hypothetical protein
VRAKLTHAEWASLAPAPTLPERAFETLVGVALEALGMLLMLPSRTVHAITSKFGGSGSDSQGAHLGEAGAAEEWPWQGDG